MPGPWTSMRANDGGGSLYMASIQSQYKERWSRQGGHYSVKAPVHAPVAVPGLRKKRPSYSVAWNL